MKPNFEYLGQLIGDYFHQDWDVEGSTDEAVVLVFRRSLSCTQIEKTILEIEDAIQLFSNDAFEADKFLTAFGCEYNYQTDGLTGLQWLERVSKILKEC